MNIAKATWNLYDNNKTEHNTTSLLWTRMSKQKTKF